MISYFLKFDRREALQYQKTILENFIVEANDELSTLEKNFASETVMRRAVNEASLTWSAMSTVLKPLTAQQMAEKKIGLQEKVVKFLRRKKLAVELMLDGNRDPQVKVFSHFLEI